MARKSNRNRNAKDSDSGGNPQKKNSSPTHQILENVEKLVELHESMENFENVEALVARLDALEKNSQSLKKSTDRIFEKIAEDSKSTDSDGSQPSSAQLDEFLELIESSLDERFEKLASERTEFLEPAPDTNALENLIEHVLIEKLAIFEEKFCDTVGSIPESQGTALDLCELGILDLINNQAKRIENSIESSLETFGGTIDDRFESTAERIEKTDEGIRALENAISGLKNQIDEFQSDDQLPRHSDSEFNSHLEAKLKEWSTTATSSVECTITTHTEGIESRLEKLTDALQGQQLAIENLQDSIQTHSSPANDDLKSMLDDLSGQFRSFLAMAPVDCGEQDDGEDSSESEATPDRASHWEKQKAAMLEKYGIDPNHRPEMEMPGQVNESVEAIELEHEANETLGEVRDSLENMSSEDADAVRNLKEELNTKLREAEVELSINRARLSQQKAELEEMQVELERREKQLLERQAESKNSDGANGGMLSRMKRHLGMD